MQIHKMKIDQLFILVSFFLFSLASCKVSCEDIKAMADGASKSPRQKSKFIGGLKKLSDKSCLPSSLFAQNGELINDNISSYFENPASYTGILSKTNLSKNDISVNVFLENSASMWGYFKGQTECEAVVAEVMVDAGYMFGDTNISFSYITDTIYPVKPDQPFTKFLQRLEPKDMTTGNYRNTQLADIFSTVIGNTKKDEISILVSDCIYSLTGGNKVDYQATEWVLIKQAFLKALKDEDFSILINKYVSSFSGKYYATNPTTGSEFGVRLDNVQRPYYVFMLGNYETIKDALEKVNFKDYKGFDNDYFLTKERPNDEVNYQVLTTDKVGKWQYLRDGTKKGMTNCQKAKRGAHEGQFGYAIGVDNSGFIVDESYILDKNNYIIPAHYELEVSVIEDSKTGLTHKLLMKTTEIKEEEVQVSFKRKTPQWVYDTSSDDDSEQSGSELDRTYGFQYFIEGIERAYDTALKRQTGSEGTDNFYNIMVKIEN